MAISSTPFALQNGSHSADLFRQAVSSFVPANGGLVTYGDLAVTQTATASMNILVGVGRAWVPGTAVGNVTGGNFSKQAMYFALNDAATTVTVNASDPTNPRIDVVYLAVQDSQYAGATNAAVLGVAQGLATSGASYPANAPGIPSNAIALAWIYVAANASSILNSNITNLAVPYNIRHAEFTGTTAPTIATVWGTGPLTLDTNASLNGGMFTSPANDKIALPSAGEYSIFVRLKMSVGASGQTYATLVNDNNTVEYTSADIQAGNASANLIIPNFVAKSAQNIRIVFYSAGTATGYTLTSRVRIDQTA